MKKVSKAILIGLAVVVALVAALLVGLNLYVQSPGAQARIQEELSKALRLPLKITNTSVSPWSDLRITGISIPGGEANFLEATSFTARYRLLPLLEGKLVIPEMRVENPKVIWAQNAEGKWVLPQPEEAAQVSLEASKVSAATPAPDTSGEPAAEKAPKVAKEEKGNATKKTFDVVIGRFDVKDGTIELLDKDRKPVATFSGVNMVYTKISADQLEGTATITKAVWAEGYTLENVSTPFSYVAANHETWLSDLNATFAGGTVRGSYRSHAETKHSPFVCKLEFNRINLDPLMTQGGGEPGQASGELRGKLDIHGETDRMDKIEGEGSLNLRDGRFSQFELFQTIGRFLNIKEFADFHITEGQAEFKLAGEKILVDRVVVQAPSLEISAKGIVRNDKDTKKEKKIALEARLSLDEAIVNRLPGKFPDAFAAADQGRRAIDFNITGTTAKPKTDLGDKLMAQTQLGSLLGMIFDDKKEEENQRKKEDEKRKKEEEEKKKVEKKDKKKKDKDSAKTKATPSPSAATPVPAADAVPSPAPSPNP